MACCKNQSAPWGDILMYENPTDELYFGEVYRTVLQEAWLPEGAQVWQRTGKSRRGRRPTQQGLYPHSPTQDQAAVRQCFSSCVAAWNALPWDNPNDPPCDARWGKEYWKKEKDDRGVPCSYYDLFMRYCLRHCIDTGCVMPSAYSLAISGGLMDAVPNKTYDISISGNCGSVSKISGPGTFMPPGEWVAPASDGEGNLGFQDANGAKGCVEYSIVEIEFIYDPDNPVLITASAELEISVIGGIPPFTWSTACPGTSFPQPITMGRTNILHAIDCPKGTGDITVIDSQPEEVSGPMEATSAGHWEYKYAVGVTREGDCGMPWVIGDLDISIGRERFQLLGAVFGRCSVGGTIVWDGANPPCGDPRSCGGGACVAPDWCCAEPPCAGQTSYDSYLYYYWECP